MNRRLRSTRLLLLPAILFALLSHHVHPEDSLIDTLLGAGGLALLILAMGGRIWANAYLAGRKDQVLVTEGPYSLVRNPLYLFSFLGFVGAGLAFESMSMAAIFGLVFFVTHWPAIAREEQKLRELFGERYERYEREVPRFIPVRWKVRSGDVIALDVLRFRTSLRDCLAIPLVFVAADLLEWAKLGGVIPVLVHIP